MPNERVQEKLQELRKLEQNMEGLGQQREAVKSDLVEVDSALDELQGEDEAYEIVGNIMVRKDADALREKLEERKDELDDRFSELASQHEDVESEAESLREELMESMQ